MNHADFEIYADASGKWRWRLRMANGNIVADSGQGYVRKEDCALGIATVKEWASRAEIVEK